MDIKQKDYLLQKISNNQALSDNDKEALSKILVSASKKYNSGVETGLTDSEYDKLYEYQPIEYLTNDNNVPHKFKRLRGTLNKVYHIQNEDKYDKRRSLEEWINTLSKSNGIPIDTLLNADILIQPKFDGVSAVFEFDENGKCNKVLSRGDDSNALDLTEKFKDSLTLPKYLKKYVPLGIKTELMVSDEDLSEIINMSYNYSSNRSFVSAMVNSTTPNKDIIKYITPIPLRWGNTNDDVNVCTELYNYPHVSCKLKDFDKIEKFASNCNIQGLHIDGIVITILDKDIQYKLGRKDSKELYEVAYKFTEEITESTVCAVNYQMGLQGNITPVVHFDPVTLKGNRITKASMYSISSLIDSNINVEDKINVLYDIVPRIELKKKINKEEIKIQEYCPECGEKLTYSDDNNLVCTNKLCPGLAIGKILLFIEKSGIDFIGYHTAVELFNSKIVTKIEDLYSLKYEDISELLGKGRSKKILDSIKKSIGMPENIFLAALSIHGFGLKKLNNIFEYITLDDIIKNAKECNIELFKSFKGFGSKNSLVLIEYINLNYDEIMRLKAIIKPSKIKIEKRCYNYIISFSKIRENDIHGLEEIIAKTHGKIGDTVTKETDILCVPSDDTESAKIKKAIKNNTRIVTMDKICKFLIDNYL